MRWLWQKVGHTMFYLCWPLLFVYLRNSNRTRAVVIYRGKILLVKNWLSDNRFALPGGGVHAGERLKDAIERELAEEIGLHGINPQHIGSEPVQELGFRFFVHFFKVRLSKQPDLSPQFLEISEAKWIAIKDLATIKCKPEVHRALKLSNKR